MFFKNTSRVSAGQGLMKVIIINNTKDMNAFAKKKQNTIAKSVKLNGP